MNFVEFTVEELSQDKTFIVSPSINILVVPVNFFKDEAGTFTYTLGVLGRVRTIAYSPLRKNFLFIVSSFLYLSWGLISGKYADQLSRSTPCTNLGFLSIFGNNSSIFVQTPVVTKTVPTGAANGGRNNVQAKKKTNTNTKNCAKNCKRNHPQCRSRF